MLQFIIRSSLVAIQLPLLKGAKNVVQGEGIVLGDIFHLTGGCRAPVFVLCAAFMTVRAVITTVRAKKLKIKSE